MNVLAQGNNKSLGLGLQFTTDEIRVKRSTHFPTLHPSKFSFYSHQSKLIENIEDPIWVLFIFFEIHLKLRTSLHI